MTVYCAVCDDMKEYALEIQERLGKVLEKREVLYDIKVYSSGKALLFDVMGEVHFDLILLDIEMPGIDGMKTAEKINKVLPDCIVIFLTSHLKYAVDAFELSVFRYIPKNEIEERFKPTIDSALNLIKIGDDKVYYVKKHNIAKKIKHNSIYYITKQGKYSVIKYNDNSTISVRKPLQKIFNELSSEKFMYIDRGTIVNIININRVADRRVTMKDNEILDVSRSNWQKLLDNLYEYWGERL